MSALGLIAVGRTMLGANHETNEDTYAIAATTDGAALLVVCDGMGGMGQGDMASTCAVAAFLRRVTAAGPDPDATLEDAVRFADTELRAALCTGPGKRQPGSTAVVALVHQGTLHLAWAGDSRGYLVRDGAVVARTRDHRVVEGLIAAGTFTREEARRSPMANVLSRGLGARPPGPEAVAPELLVPARLQVGDWLLLCCDGLVDRLEDRDLVARLDDRPLADIARALAADAVSAGATDDVTVVLARVVDAHERRVIGRPWADHRGR